MTNPVRFSVEAKEHAKLDDVQSRLEQLASDLKIHSQTPQIYFLHGSTSQSTYESVFKAKLTYDAKHNQWQETVRASVPTTLANDVNTIELDPQFSTYRQ